MSLRVTEPQPSRFSRFGARLRIATGRTLNIALPPLCLACRQLVSEKGLCAACWGKLSFIAPPYCERLGIPFAYDPGPGVLSMQALADPPSYQRARAAVRYDEVARTLVHALKYGDRLELAPLMGRWIARAGHELLAQADALVPVPLHWRRLWMRRFNQSTLLAKAISHASGVPITETALKRVKATTQQVGLSKSERAQNVQGAFRVPPESKPAIKGRRFILVDDVLTSGATVDACARRLLRAGAANVDVLVFARVVDTVRAPI